MIRPGSPPLPGIVRGELLSDDRFWIPRQAAVEPQPRRNFMRALISALVVAGVVGFALPAVADDAVTAPNKPKAAGRAIDEGGAVTAPNKPKAAGRAIDEGGAVTAPNKPKAAGRAIEGDAVT